MTVENEGEEEAFRTRRKKCLVGTLGLFAGGAAVLSATGVSVNTMLAIGTILLMGGVVAIAQIGLILFCCAVLNQRNSDHSPLPGTPRN
jgi:hypothetical protein